jgi:hypothetical protein
MMRLNLGGKASAKGTTKATRLGGKASAKGASTTTTTKYPRENLAHTPLAAKHLPQGGHHVTAKHPSRNCILAVTPLAVKHLPKEEANATSAEKHPPE